MAPEPLQEKLACDSMAPHRARAFLRQLEPELGIQQMLDLKVVVSELAAMAIRFGPGRALVLEVRMDRDGNVAGEFGADAGWESVVAAARSDPGAGKLALRLLDRLCPDWGLDNGGGIHFRVERRRGAGLGTARG